MAGLRLNYGTKQPPEYSNVPNADSVNGTKGTNTAGAKRNQAEQKPPPADAWAQFGQAARGWGSPPGPAPAPTAPAPAPTTPRMPAGAPTSPPSGMTPAQLAGVIRGGQGGQGAGQAPSSGGGAVPSGGAAPPALGPPPNQGAPVKAGVGQPSRDGGWVPTSPPTGGSPIPASPFDRGPKPAVGGMPPPLPPPTIPGGPPGGAGKLSGAPTTPGAPGGLTVGNEGGAPPGALNLHTNPNFARRDQGEGTANPAPVGAPPNPIAPPVAPPLSPSTTSPTGTRAIGADPNADPTTPATLPGRALGGTGSLTPAGPPGGQVGGAAGTPPPGTVRGSAGNLGGGQDMGPGAAGTPAGAVRPEGWGDFETQKLNEYITAGYGFLKDNPDMLARYWADQGRTGEKGVDLPDWLAAQYPTIDWSQVPENARPGRQGYDTWRFTDANGTPRGFAPQSGPPGQAGNARGAPASSPWISNAPGAPTSGSPYGGDRAIQGQQDAAWQAAEDAKKKAAEAAAAAPPGASTTANANPNPNAPSVPPVGLGTSPNANPNPATTQPPIREGGPVADGPGAEGGHGENYVDRLLNPLHQQQQQDLLRVLRQQGANEGTINSGAFGDVVGKAEGSLIAQQGAQKAQFISENENRALQKYGIDQGKIIAEMQDATQRFGIKTNADLERWLNSADSDTLQRYGIDKNDMLSRYKADLEASGQKYSADQQVNAARLQAGATRSAAGAAASAAMHDAQLRYQLGVQQLGQSGAQFGAQNQLDWAQLQAGLYNNDSNRQLGWATLASQLGMTPAQLTQILGGYQPPAPVYNAP